MTYLLSFLEGIITFISPCLLPMLPVYVSYLAGGGEAGNMRTTVRHALGFITGFTLVFVALGAFAGLLGGLLIRHQWLVNLITGAVVVLFGLHYLGVLRIALLDAARGGSGRSTSGFLSAVLFGMVFSLSWTPCVGAFLGSALMLASMAGSAVQGMLMLLCYALGLGVPFLLAAALIERLKTAFDFIKKHYKVINMVSGIFLVLIGVLMMTGLMGMFLSLLSF